METLSLKMHYYTAREA